MIYIGMCKEKERPFFRAKNEHVHLKSAHTAEVRAQANRD